VTLLLDAIFFAVSSGHLVVDFLSGQRYVLLTYMTSELGMSNVTLGFLSMTYNLSAALIQPFFGYITDKVGPRWLITSSVLWMGIFYSLGTLTPGKEGIILFMLASIGSGAFHPAATMLSTERGRILYSGRETTAAAYFFLFGQTGAFFGPLLGGLMLDHAGPTGLAFMAILVLPVGLNALVRLRAPVMEDNTEEVVSSSSKRLRQGAFVIFSFALLAAFQSWSQQNMVTFVPKYLSELGQTPGVYGVVTALFTGGYALGNFLGGNLADRFGKRLVVSVMFALAGLSVLLLPLVGISTWLYFLIPVAGALIGANFSIIVVLAQRIIPGGKAMASGLILGFLFSSGALGSWLSGYIADLWGFSLVFYLTTALLLIASILTLTLQNQ
jgi:MFS transporter, FSR family, fosmidomycin resistance protein